MSAQKWLCANGIHGIAVSSSVHLRVRKDPYIDGCWESEIDFLPGRNGAIEDLAHGVLTVPLGRCSGYQDARRMALYEFHMILSRVQEAIRCTDLL